MRPECKGCKYRRPLNHYKKETACHYTYDTGRARPLGEEKWVTDKSRGFEEKSELRTKIYKFGFEGRMRQMDEKKKLKVCWLSAGVSSFVAGYISRSDIDKYIYIDIKDQHPDSMRFIHDCEDALGKNVEVLRSEQYDCVGDVCRAFRFVNSAHGAKCTEVLKKRVRKKWEYNHKDCDLTYVWGMDLSEKSRADRLFDTMPYAKHEFPLIENSLTKANAHGLCFSLGIKRPAMYDMGYSNNNCIGCVKGGMGYWNRIRLDFPEVFDDRAKMEREIGHSILHNKNGMVFLDELDPSVGRMTDEIMEDCSIFCQLAIS